MPDVEEQPGPDTALARAPARTSRSLDRLNQLRQLIEQASPDHGLPQLLVTEAASAAGAASAVLGALSGDRLLELTWAADPSAGQEAAPDAVPLALSIATAVTQPVWLSSRAELARRFPRLADVPAPGELACAVLPVPAHGVRLGFLALVFAGPRDFDPREREYLLSLADEAALGLSRSRPTGPLRPALSGTSFEQLDSERAARQRAERLQAMMRALVGSASLADVRAAVFEHGLLPFGASAARLLLTNQQANQQASRPLTVSAVGMAEPALTEWRDLPLSAYSPSRKALLTSEIVYVPNIDELRREFPHARLGEAANGRAWAAVPLRSGGQTLGVLTLVFGRPHALDGVSDQIALAALGSAIADAVSRAAAHDSDRDLVASLQRSLLAGPLPEVPGVRLAARYTPAEARHGMGGDWYDAIPLSGGRVMLVVGDVAGHGLEAAMTMGQVRSAARALAPSHEPDGLLAALDQFLSTTASERLATAVVGVIDPARRTLRYCQAGHPPPLLRQPDGSVTVLDQATGLLLGLETTDRPESEISYAPGSHLVLYTDGLVERRDDPSVGSGIARLTGQLTRAVPSSPAELCDVLISDGLPSEGREDDTAILCALLY